MGWDFKRGATKSDIIQSRISREGTKRTCLAHAVRGNILWTVWEYTNQENIVKRYIGCDILGKQKNYGWGYKDMCESMHPYYYSCPLNFLDKAPVECEEWRQGVREYHRKMGMKFSVGDVVKLVGCLIPEVRVFSIKPLLGEYMGKTYKIPKKHIA